MHLNRMDNPKGEWNAVKKVQYVRGKLTWINRIPKASSHNIPEATICKALSLTGCKIFLSGLESSQSFKKMKQKLKLKCKIKVT